MEKKIIWMGRFEPGILSAIHQQFIVDAKCEKGQTCSIDGRRFLPLIRATFHTATKTIVDQMVLCSQEGCSWKAGYGAEGAAKVQFCCDMPKKRWSPLPMTTARADYTDRSVSPRRYKISVGTSSNGFCWYWWRTARSSVLSSV